MYVRRYAGQSADGSRSWLRPRARERPGSAWRRRCRAVGHPYSHNSEPMLRCCLLLGRLHPCAPQSLAISCARQFVLRLVVRALMCVAGSYSPSSAAACRAPWAVSPFSTCFAPVTCIGGVILRALAKRPPTLLAICAQPHTSATFMRSARRRAARRVFSAVAPSAFIAGGASR